MSLLFLNDNDALVGCDVYHRDTAAAITAEVHKTGDLFPGEQQEAGERSNALRLSLSSDNASPPCPPILLLVTTILLLSLSVEFERKESE